MMAESPYVPILEIRDEFVTCEICMEYFNDGEKCPRILPCHHSFCCQCLISLWENSPQGVTCPNCQHVWPVRNSIEATFQQNKVLSNLVEYIALKNRTGDTICHECPNDSKASFRCFDCQQYMCEGCTACHRKFTTTKTHKTVLITELINMSQDEYFQENEMCQNHENVKLEIFCKGCSTPVCPNCALVSHRDHDICNLKDIYNEKKTLIRAGLKCLQVSEETLKTVSESLAVGNQTVAVRERNMLIDIDEKSNKTIAKVMEITRRLKEDVISKAAKQKALRTEQIELIAQSQGVKAEHILHCQQALQFSCQVELINMSHVLENETKNLMKTPKLPKLKMGTINMDLTVFEQIDKTIQKTAILDDKPELSPCIEVMDATIEENSTVVTIVLLPKENMLKDNKIVVVSAIQCEDVHQNLEQRVKTFADIAESLQYRHDITAPDKTSMSINGRQLSGDRFVLHKREQGFQVIPNYHMRNQTPGTAGQTQMRAPMYAASMAGHAQRMGMPTTMQNLHLSAHKPGRPRRHYTTFEEHMGETQMRPRTDFSACQRPQQSVLIPGQEPLAASPPQEQKQMLGERLFPLIQRMQPDLAGKITGMLLEIDNSELLHMLKSSVWLKAKVEEAVAVLQAHQAKETVGPPKKD